MEVFELSITKPFHDLYSFDSRTVRCIGGIKYLVVVISQLPMKRILMDVVVADIPQKLECYYLDLIPCKWEEHYRWIVLMPQLICLELKLDNFIERYIWHIL